MAISTRQTLSPEQVARARQLKKLCVGHHILNFIRTGRDEQYPRKVSAELGPFMVYPASVTYELPEGENVECDVELSENGNVLLAHPVDEKYIKPRTLSFNIPIFVKNGGNDWSGREPDTGKIVLIDRRQHGGKSGNVWHVICSEQPTYLRGRLVSLVQAAGDRKIDQPVEFQVEDKEFSSDDPAEIVRKLFEVTPRFSFLGQDALTPTQVLGLRHNFPSRREIELALRKVSIKAHPDQGGSWEDLYAARMAAAWLVWLGSITTGDDVDLNQILGVSETDMIPEKTATDQGGTGHIADGEKIAPKATTDQMMGWFQNFVQRQNVKPQVETEEPAAPIQQVTPAAPTSAPAAATPTPQVLDLETWSRDALREAAVRLELKKGKGDKRDLIPLIATHLETNPTAADRIANLAPAQKAGSTTPTE